MTRGTIRGMWAAAAVPATAAFTLGCASAITLAASA